MIKEPPPARDQFADMSSDLAAARRHEGAWRSVLSRNRTAALTLTLAFGSRRRLCRRVTKRGRSRRRRQGAGPRAPDPRHDRRRRAERLSADPLRPWHRDAFRDRGRETAHRRPSHGSEFHRGAEREGRRRHRQRRLPPLPTRPRPGGGPAPEGSRASAKRRARPVALRNARAQNEGRDLRPADRHAAGPDQPI